MQIILYQPQIPQNTGNIVRTCSVTGASLGLVPPLGFSLNDRWLKRAGLDYWEGVDVTLIPDLDVHLDAHLEKQTGNVYFFTSKVTKRYCDVQYTSNDILVFGSETNGLPQTLLDKWPEQAVTLPMHSQARCLNLATSVGIALYEAWRQLDFKPMVAHR